MITPAITSNTPAGPVPMLRDFEGSTDFPCPGNADLCLDIRIAMLQACPSVAFAIDIVAREGVVYLSGSVDSDLRLVQLYKAARSVPGVRWVCNDVTVQRDPLRRAFDDEELLNPLAA